MSAEAVKSMAVRRFSNPVYSVLSWGPPVAPAEQTRVALGMTAPGQSCSRGVNCQRSDGLGFGLDRVTQGNTSPALVVGMAAGFVGVTESK